MASYLPVMVLTATTSFRRPFDDETANSTFLLYGAVFLSKSLSEVQIKGPSAPRRRRSSTLNYQVQKDLAAIVQTDQFQAIV